MADLYNVQNQRSVYTPAALTTAQAVDLDLARYDTFVFVGDSGAGAAQTLTWLGVVAGRYYNVEFFWTLPGTTDQLKPTNTASTNSDGTTLIFHSDAAITGAGNAAWPTFTTTAGLAQFFNWKSPDGVNFYLVGAYLVALDE